MFTLWEISRQEDEIRVDSISLILVEKVLVLVVQGSKAEWDPGLWKDHVPVEIHPEMMKA